MVPDGSRPAQLASRARIAALREHLAAIGAKALLVPSADPHLSEYLPDRWQGRRWLSGFTGSQATLIVAAHKAALFADSRYWEQAEAELAGSGVDLVKIPNAGSMLHLEWLARELPKGAVVAVDGQVLGLGAASALRAALDTAGIALRTDVDLLDAVWTGRPGLPTEAVYEHEPPHATQTRAQKLAAVRDAMTKHQATHHLVSSVDDVAWITNLRGADVTYNPVFLAHLLITRTEATLFVGAGKVPAALAARLAADGITLAPYEQAGAALAALGPGSTLLVDPKRVAFGVCQRAGSGCVVKEAINPSTLLEEPQDACGGRVHPRGHGRGRRRDVRVLRVVRGRAGAGRARHRAHRRRTAQRGARAAPGIHGAELRHHRRLQRQRRDAALPGDRGAARADCRRRAAAHRQRRPVPRRYYRHHSHLGDRNPEMRRSSVTTRWC